MTKYENEIIYFYFIKATVGWLCVIVNERFYAKVMMIDLTCFFSFRVYVFCIFRFYLFFFLFICHRCKTTLIHKRHRPNCNELKMDVSVYQLNILVHIHSRYFWFVHRLRLSTNKCFFIIQQFSTIFNQLRLWW